jgi:hypothetical protein
MNLTDITNGPQDIGHHEGGPPLTVPAGRSGVEHEAAIVRAMLDAHVVCCFRAPRGKKEESRQECIRDTMAAALALALAAFDAGAKAASHRVWPRWLIEKSRAEIKALAQGEAPADDAP